MIECLTEAGCGRLIDLRYTETAGQRGRHARIPNKTRTVVRVNQARMMQGAVPLKLKARELAEVSTHWEKRFHKQVPVKVTIYAARNFLRHFRQITMTLFGGAGQ